MNKRGHQGGARTLAGKRGQLTIFVILGIALIVLVFMTFFLFYSNEPIQQTNSSSATNEFARVYSRMR